MDDAKSKAQEAKGYRELETRGTEEVLYRHRCRSLRHDLEGYLRENHAQDVVMIEPAGTLQGHQGVYYVVSSGGDSSVMR